MRRRDEIATVPAHTLFRYIVAADPAANADGNGANATATPVALAVGTIRPDVRAAGNPDRVLTVVEWTNGGWVSLAVGPFLRRSFLWFRVAR